MTMCNATLSVTNVKQYIATEEYPRNYQKDQSCSWTFVAPLGEIIYFYIEETTSDRAHGLIDYRKRKVFTKKIVKFSLMVVYNNF